jgi:hypothetical protein
MRTTSHDGEFRAGVAAAVKAAAVVLAVGMLAVVAGKAGYTTESIAASPGHAFVAAPAGVPATEMQYPMPPRSMAAPAPEESPVATF